MEKICKRCLISKYNTDYSKHPNFKDGLNTICKECKRKENLKNYRDNPEKYNKSKRDRCKVLRNYINNYLSNKSCIDCGNNNAIVLEFDHVTGIKNNNISRMVSTAVSLDALELEIAKCEIRCANCHRIRHYYEDRRLAER